MNDYRPSRLIVGAVLALTIAAMLLVPAAAQAAPNSSAPTSTVRLVFVHHSTGEAWLNHEWGQLGPSLGANNYFVSDTNYGWGPDASAYYSSDPHIGNHTDIGDWWTWFRSSDTATFAAALYANSDILASYARTLPDPGGENTVIMFKSCFPNSNVGGSPADAIPDIGSNPLKGNSMNELTVGNAKGVYLDLLEYFKLHPDKMFVLVTSPPLKSNETNAAYAANARALANWLVNPNGLLSGYSAGNVFVFDYYTVLTGGHHRIVDGMIEHSAGPINYSAYPTTDSHPSAAGDMIATAEFVPMLNAARNSWRAGTGAMLFANLTPRTASLSTPSAGRTKLSHKKTYTWRGNISPAQIDSSVVRLEIQRLVHKKWRSYTTSSAALRDRSTSWSVKLRVKKTGTFRIRARHSDSDHLASVSRYRKFSVK